MTEAATGASPPFPIPDVLALVAGPRGAVFVSNDGEIEELDRDAAGARARSGPPPLVCHARALARRLSLAPFPAFDLLELFAFALPARFCVPTPNGLAVALDLSLPSGLEAEALTLLAAARALLERLSRPDFPGSANAAAIAAEMAKGGWLWGDAVLAAFKAGGHSPKEEGKAPPLAVWARLEEWPEFAPHAPPGHHGVTSREARARLSRLLGSEAEPRPQQADYASAAAGAFAPREEEGAPNVTLAEAGTGVGKTLGYIAPASVWAEKNKGAVWLSTFTRNLQRQIDHELDRLYPDPHVKAEKAVLRKGRENYLCLLNYEEAVGRAALLPGERIALGLMARWALETRDGDMAGGDFPAWLVDLLGVGRTLELTDRRGECIYAACSHWRKCFIERGQRAARRADLVIANHALVMVQAAFAALDEEDERQLPLRYVFDEGHHLFDAADGAFSAHLSGVEASELRRWVLGMERSGRAGAPGSVRPMARARGLKNRIGDLVEGTPEAEAMLEDALAAARGLPAEGWPERLRGRAPRGPAEGFLALVRRQVLARAADREGPYSLETETHPLSPGLAEVALSFDQALAALARPLDGLARHLARRLDEEADELDGASRIRIEAARRGLLRRGRELLESWRGMLASLMGAGVEAGAPEGFVDWFELERADGREVDVGMHRHHLDPMVPFAEHLLKRAHGVLVTSATLRDGTGDVEADWRAAEIRTGTRHLSRPGIRAQVPSPFDYARQTRVFVVRDVRRDDPDQVAAAYRELFLAAGGGALGLFTAITRLKAVHGRIAGALDEAGIALYAQHVDALDTTTLVEIFRAEADACLLGTDAVRDGVDVPGRALRLIVFDRVPWPRPDVLHRARRGVFGGNRYDDMLTRLRLKQAYGRLIRRADDAGVFVLLDPMMPSRLEGAFPPTVEVRRTGLAQAVEAVGGFVGA